MHLAAGYDIDSRNFLLQNCSLRGSQLGIGEIARRELPQGYQTVHGFVPAGYAMSSDNRGRILFVFWHASPSWPSLHQSQNNEQREVLFHRHLLIGVCAQAPISSYPGPFVELTEASLGRENAPSNPLTIGYAL
jgi:hypothetical protein